MVASKPSTAGTMQPELWLLAGGNGSGKSTFYERFLKRRNIPLINADNIARTLWPLEPEAHSYEAALIAEKERFRLIDQKQTFCFETVYSHPSKLDFIAIAKAAGFRILIFYFHLDDPSLNNARVSTRVKAGGHNVPEEKVASRIPRTFANVRDSVGLADELHLVDNSSSRRPYVRVATWKEGVWELFTDRVPDWASQIMD